MQDLQKRADELTAGVAEAVSKLQIDLLETELKQLQAESRQPEFWTDNLHAQEVMRRISKLEARVSPWRELQQEVNELAELVGLNDESLRADLGKQLDGLESRYESLKYQLKFSGEYDDFDAIVSIHAGAGGTDAQDWAQMLLRMYVRWAESSDLSVSTIDESAADEAGIKSATIEVSGSFAYGKLKGEHGVHRLVRLSPFNSDNLRQTSFAKIEVLPKVDKPDAVKIDEKDLKVDVYRSGGSGGQSVNTTDSAVRVTHVPTGITVAIQNERSQLQNKETAMTILRSRLAQLKQEQHQEAIEELKGPNQSAEWGNQIRSYVLHPYKMVKDLRTSRETSDTDSVLDGDLDQFINAYLEHTLGDNS